VPPAARTVEKAVLSRRHSHAVLEEEKRAVVQVLEALVAEAKEVTSPATTVPHTGAVSV
jgi:hypothetical protein